MRPGTGGGVTVVDRRAVRRRRPPEAGAPGGADERSEAALVKIAPSSSQRREEAARERRNEAWRLRRRLWEVSTLPRVRACGRTSRTAGGPTLRVSEGRAGLAGLVSCASPWSCPTCARKIGAQRAQEIRDVVAAVYADGGAVSLVTLTLRHHAGHRLTDSWSALRHAWSRVTSGRAYQREQQQFGVLGFISAVEVTHGAAGFHPHLHVVVVHDTPVSQELVEEMGGRWFARFERALGRRGFSALEFQGGLDVRIVDADSSGALGAYLAKLALEVTGAMTKTGRRHSSRTMWQVLADGLATGLADDFEAWFEYEQASHGRKQVTFSRGLRRRYRLAEEETDEAIAEHDLGSDDLITLPADTWHAVRACAEQLLTAAEVDGLQGAAAWLNARRLTWGWARPAPRSSELTTRTNTPRPRTEDRS